MLNVVPISLKKIKSVNWLSITYDTVHDATLDDNDVTCVDRSSYEVGLPSLVRLGGHTCLYNV